MSKQIVSYAIKADFINPFLTSTLSALVDLASMAEVTPNKPLLKIGSKAEGSLTSVIDMNGTPVFGSYAVNFSEGIIDEICQRVFADDIEKGVERLELSKDFIGEFSNIVCGRAKNLLSRKGYCFGLATPRIICGQNHDVKHAIKGPVLQVPFCSPWGDFHVETSFCAADNYYAPLSKNNTSTDKHQHSNQQGYAVA